MRVPTGAVLVLSLAVAGVTAAACTSAPTPASPSPASPAQSSQAPSGDGGHPRALTARDWPTYHRDAARTGAAPAQPAAGPMAIAWRRQLDGAVYGQPLAVGSLVIAATEGDTVYGLDRDTGQVRWHAHLGTPVPLSSLPCGNIDPLGITSTPVYDPAAGLVYVVAETAGFHHVLAGIGIGAGQVRFRRDIPTPDGRPRYDQQRAALTAERGRVYVALGGLFGDCGPYRGSIVGIPASGRGPLVSYTVPTAQRGGIWAPGGPVIAPGGTIYVSIGNGAATSPPFDGSDSVTALTPRLQRVGIFAPSTWAADNAGDIDLGSASPAWLAGGKILAAGKRGTAYLLNARRLPNLGAPLAQTGVCAAFGGMAARGTVAYLPCASGGMAAVDTAGDQIRVLWRGPAGAQGSPVVGGGVVWVADWNSGMLYQLDPATGRVLRQISVGAGLPHFASPSLSGRLALVGTLNGVVAVSGA